MIKEIKGDLLELTEQGKFRVIVHGCNCHHAMASGIAGQIAKKYPEARNADDDTLPGVEKLGTCSFVTIRHFTIINAYTQSFPGSGSLSYQAIKDSLEFVRDNFGNLPIGLPLIGAGIAGGDWNVIRRIIYHVFRGNYDVTIVYFDRDIPTDKIY